MTRGRADMAYALSDLPPPDMHHRLTAGMGTVRKLLDVLRAEMTDAQVAPALNDTTQIIMAEVLNNVVEHAYRYAHGHVMEVSVWLRADGILCEVRDEGEPMPWGRAPSGVMPPVDPDRPGTLPEGGFGWALVRDLTRDIRYCRELDQNRLQFLIPSGVAPVADDGID